MMTMRWIKKRFSLSGHAGNDESSSHSSGELKLINIGMTLKGNHFDRPDAIVRPCSVTMDGSTRRVTSRDKADKETCKTLLEVP